MAKTIAPLFSIEASGQIGKTLVYDRRGWTRIYTVPTNPRTDPQANVRHPFAGTAAVVKVIHQNVENEIRAVAEAAGKPGYRWASYLVGEVLRGNGWATYEATFNGFPVSNREDWQQAALNIGIAPTVLDYGTAPYRLAGRSLFIVASAMFHRLGLGTAAPDQNNPTDWANYIAGTSSSP